MEESTRALNHAAQPSAASGSSTLPDGASSSSSAASSGAIERFDAALVDRVLSMNPRVRRLNLSHNAISMVEDGDEEMGESGAGGGGGGREGEDTVGFASPLARLTHVTFINLSHNALTRLGPGFGRLASLTAIDVSHNVL